MGIATLDTFLMSKIRSPHHWVGDDISTDCFRGFGSCGERFAVVGVRAGRRFVDVGGFVSVFVCF